MVKNLGPEIELGSLVLAISLLSGYFLPFFLKGMILLCMCGVKVGVEYVLEQAPSKMQMVRHGLLE